MRVFRNCIDYFGQVIHPGNLRISKRTIAAICGLGYPTTVSELWSFLCLRDVFHRFLPNFARIAAPLNKELCRGQLPPLWLIMRQRISSRFGDDQSENSGTLWVGSSTFARDISIRYGHLRQADWTDPEKAALQNQRTNRISVTFIK